MSKVFPAFTNRDAYFFLLPPHNRPLRNDVERLVAEAGGFYDSEVIIESDIDIAFTIPQALAPESWVTDVFKRS